MITIMQDVVNATTNPYFFEIPLDAVASGFVRYDDPFTVEGMDETFQYRYTAREGGYLGTDWAFVFTGGNKTIRILFG